MQLISPNVMQRVSFFCLWLLLIVLPEPAHINAQPASPQPNILIAISDDQSYPYASAYGSTTVQTPNFDQVAEQGVLFTNAFVASPGCSPSRAALLTGRYPWQLEHAGTHASYFSPEYVVFPDLLEAAGYAIGFTGKGWGPGDWAHLGRNRNPAGTAFNEHKKDTGIAGLSNNDYAANFEQFLNSRVAGQPFYFWYGASEPHRVFERGIGVANGRKLYEAEVPDFLPDAPPIRSDLLDYAFEIEHFDDHLGRMITLLEEAGELQNTIVIVTSDNGMAFPRAKANTYEYGIHVPLAIMWPAQISAHRTLDDLVSLIDLAPTLLEAADVEHPTPGAFSGQSLIPLLSEMASGDTDGSSTVERTAIYAGRERHSSSRFNSLSYPQRALRTKDFLFIQNFTPERWPAGAPQKLEADGTYGVMHGGYHDIDAAPSLTYLIENRETRHIGRFFHLAVDLRPPIELYDIRKDPGCLQNLANAPGYQQIKNELHSMLTTFLNQTQDPRTTGNGDIWDTYPRVSPLRRFPEPYWIGEGIRAFKPDWID